jgi:hypothetical protein
MMIMLLSNCIRPEHRCTEAYHVGSNHGRLHWLAAVYYTALAKLMFGCLYTPGDSCRYYKSLQLLLNNHNPASKQHQELRETA